MNTTNILNIIKKQQKFFQYLIISVIVKYSTFIFDIIVIHKLSKENFGKYSLILLVVNLAFTFGFNWHSSVLLFIGAKEKAERGRFNHTFHARNIITLIFLLIVTIVFIVGNKFISDYIGIRIISLLLIYIYSRVFSDYLRQYFFATQKQKIAQYMVLVTRLFQIGIVLFLNVNLQNLIILMSACEFLSIFFIYKVNFKDLFPVRTNWITVKNVFNFAFWQLFGFAGLYLINFGDIAVINHYLTIEDVAIYNAAYKIFFGVAGLSYAIINYYAADITSALKQNNFKRIKIFYKDERKKILFIVTIGVILLMSTSKWIIPVVCGNEYTQSSGIFSVLLIGAIFQYFSLFYTIFLNTTKRYKILQTVNIFRAILNIVLDIIFIRFLGIYGPAVATVLAMLIAYLILFFYSERKIRNVYQKS